MELPDGKTLDLGTELFHAPEIIFQPDFAKIDEPCVDDAVISSIK
jgi:hypothetical protein